MAGGPLGDGVNLIRQLGTNSSIYAVTNLLQKGAAFLLLPLYTRYLDPSAYGVLAVVTAINALLGVLFTLGLTSAVTRFYFEHEHEPRVLAEFWGSVLTFVLLVSALLAGALLLAGETLLRPLAGDIAFWPFIAIGVATSFFQPFFATFLAVLQTRNQSLRFAAISLAHFALLSVLTVVLVVVQERGAFGALLATLVATGCFFVVSLVALRKQLRPGLQWRHLKPALAYSLPLVPHSVASQATAFADRLVLNRFMGTAQAGIYAVGAMVSMVVEVAAQSVNRAYVPLSMAALKRGEARDFLQIEALGTVTISVFCLLGAGIGSFGPEIMMLLAAPRFAQAAHVVPWLAFAGVANGFYLLFVNVLFYERRAVRLVPVGTVVAGVASIALSLLLVPRYGLHGAAWSALAAQVLATMLIAMLAQRFDPVRWRYGVYGVAFASALTMTCVLATIGPSLSGIAIKLGALLVLAVWLGALLWGQPLILARATLCALRARPDAAAELLYSVRARP